MRLLSRRYFSQGLMRDPLEMGNIRQIRESSSEFALPSVLSFDAFNTLYYPKKPVYLQYHEIASKEFGFAKSAEAIQNDFPRIYSELSAKFPNYGKWDGMQSSDEWWKELIVKLFETEHHTRNEKANSLCERLIQHFSGPEAYALYDDVVPVFQKLAERGVRVVVSSNSDERVRSIVNNLGLGEYVSDVFLSYELDHSKPNKSFYDAVLAQCVPNARARAQAIESAWHVGDDYAKDFVGSIKSGWNGVLVDRKGTSEFFKDPRIAQVPDSDCFMAEQEMDIKHQGLHNNDELLILANNRVVVRNLKQVLTIFGISQ